MQKVFSGTFDRIEYRGAFIMTETATLTWFSGNYGSTMQAFALQKTVMELGYGNHIIQTDYMTFLQLSGKLHIKRRLKSCIHCVIITCSAHSPLSIAAKWRISVLMCRLKDFVGCTEQ